MSEIIVVAHNIRSTHNVGAIFRTAEGLGVKKIILTGYTPYPILPSDTRLPHIANKLTAQIHKTALGAENSVPFEYRGDLDIAELRSQGYRIVALEQAPRSIPLHAYRPAQNTALILGEEVHGIPEAILSQCDDIIEIAMKGNKESFNVSVAAGIALYQLTLE